MHSILGANLRPGAWQILTELWGWPVTLQMENSFKCGTIMRCTVLVFCIQDEKRILWSAGPCAVLVRVPVVLQVWGRVVCLSCLLGPPSRGPSGHSWGTAPLQWSWHESGSQGACQEGRANFREQHGFHYHAWNRYQNIIIHSKQFVVCRGASIDVFEGIRSLWDACDLAFCDIIN